MSSLLTTGTIISLTGQFARHFDTFSAFRSIIVYKEPLKVVINSSGDTYPGYGDPSNPDNFTYIPVSGTFPAIVVYDKRLNDSRQAEIQTLSAIEKITIKVQKDARDYIKNGTNERFEIDGLVFNGLKNEAVQNYLGLTYYYFTLISTT